MPRKPLPSSVFLLLGLASAVAGLLPWLITGMRLPLQNLWATETLEMPVGLLPFSQYYLFLIVAVIVVGSAIAGVVVRQAPARTPRAALRATVLGVLLVQVAATVQTAMTVSGGLRGGSAAEIYLTALVGGTAVAILLGLAVLLLIARAPRPGVLIAGSVAALALGEWLSAVVVPVGVVTVSEPVHILLSLTRWVPAIAVGALIAWCGIRSVGRVIAAIVSLLVLWMGSALITAVTSAAGTRVLAGNPSDMLDYGMQVFRSAIVDQAFWGLLIPAIAVAFVGLVAREVVQRRAVASPSL